VLVAGLLGESLRVAAGTPERTRKSRPRRWTAATCRGPGPLHAEHDAADAGPRPQGRKDPL